MGEYEKRRAETLAERLFMRLVENGVLSETDESDLRWPSDEQLDEAEARF